MSVKQVTLSGEFQLKGRGLHTGQEVCVTFKPAAEDTGYQIVRTDIEGCPVIPATAAYAKDADRSSCLEKDGVRIFTMEHALAALYGCGIDNCIMELTGDEFPILDGSAKYYVEQIAKVGTVEQDKDRNYFIVREKIEYTNPETGTKITILPDSEFNVNTLISYDSPYLAMQYATYQASDNNFAAEVAPCRTFVFLREVEPLLAAGLIKGGDLSNAIVIVDKEISDEDITRLCEKFGYENLEVQQGVLNTIKLQFDNEPARHKMLDLIGDLALCGRFFKGRVIAERSGHKANTAMAKKLMTKIAATEKDDAVPFIDWNATPLMDINKIKSLLPHRPPFLLVDRIFHVSENCVIGSKSVTMNEPFFVGHFPNQPVMPGVLIVEAMAQCGGIMVLSGVEDPENYSTFFMKIDNVKFRRMVVPGDTIVFKLITTAPTRRGVVSMKGFAFVGKNLVAEGEFMAQVAKTK